MRKKVVTSLLTLAAPLLVGCGAEYAPYTPEDAPSALGTAEAAVAACEGDDLQYDFNAFSASLAVAIANEMGRWDVMTDFNLQGGRLELSQTGRMLCGDDCQNVEAILALQQDASDVVPYHSPSLFREKLAGWYIAQEQLLVEDASANQVSGVYRLVSKYNNKRITALAGSSNSGAGVRVYGWTSYTAADEWELRPFGNGHALVNIRSGRCMDLQYDSGWAPVIQNECSDAGTQRFEIVNADSQYAAIQTKHGRSLEIQNWNNGDGAVVAQGNWNIHESNKLWRLESVGGSQSVAQRGVANGMFALVARHSGKAIAVANSSVDSGAGVGNYTYRSGASSMEWYVSKSGSKYQLINRHSRLCLSADGGWGVEATQEACANVSHQLFNFEKSPGSGEEHYSLQASSGRFLEVQNWSTNEGAKLVIGPTSGGGQNTQFRMDEILAGEPHELSFSHITNDGPCGDYYWYEVSQPNGLPLASPEDTFEQLVFAGGKDSLTSSDENPFIAQQTSGTLVAIDPSSYMNGGTRSSSGSCVASDIFYDPTRSAAGRCCIKYNGRYGSFAQSFWSTTTFQCK